MRRTLGRTRNEIKTAIDVADVPATTFTTLADGDATGVLMYNTSISYVAAIVALKIHVEVGEHSVSEATTGPTDVRRVRVW